MTCFFKSMNRVPFGVAQGRLRHAQDERVCEFPFVVSLSNHRSEEDEFSETDRPCAES